MRLLLIALGVCAAAVAQDAPASPSAKELSALMDQAGAAGARGDTAGALRLLDTALAKTKSDPALKGRDSEVIRARGRVYSNAKQYPAAVQTYKGLLESMKAQCVPGNPLAEVCADTYYDLGTAQMYTEDWTGAAASLRKGIPLYQAMQKSAVRADFKMAKLKLEANTQSMLAAALFRGGNLPAAITTYQKAIQEYKTVADNPDSGDGLRMLARQSMANEQQSLNMVMQEQKVRASQQAPPKKEEAPKGAKK